jgi:DNA polymerase-3 subunit gamma/tau
MQQAALARKWRPKCFADLVGQNIGATILMNSIKNNKLHHAITLTGTRGIGKTTIARIIAKGLNCLNVQNGDPCATCETCLQIDKGSFIDVIELSLIHI